MAVLGIISFIFHLVGLFLSIFLLCVHAPGLILVRGLLIGALVFNIISIILTFISGRE